jgi:cytochrome c biogenesis protein CcdA
MPSDLHNKQKSLKRRFLLILGITVFICVSALGLMIIFDQLNLDMSPTYRILVGSLFILYGIIRVTRIFRKQPDE